MYEFFVPFIAGASFASFFWSFKVLTLKLQLDNYKEKENA